MRKVLNRILFLVPLALTAHPLRAQVPAMEPQGVADSVRRQREADVREVRAAMEREARTRGDTLSLSQPLPDSISQAERASAIAIVLDWRAREIGDGARIGTCDLYHVLGRGSGVVERLRADTLLRLADDGVEGCRRGSDFRPPSTPWWVLWSIRRQGDRELVVEGTLTGRFGNKHQETFVLEGRRTAAGLASLRMRELRVDRVRVM